MNFLWHDGCNTLGMTTTETNQFYAAKVAADATFLDAIETGHEPAIETAREAARAADEAWWYEPVGSARLPASAASLRAAHSLAEAHHHEWAGIISEAEVVRAGSLEVIEALCASRLDPHRHWPGQAPSLSHVTGSGRLAWDIDPAAGKITLKVSRPEGVAVAVTLVWSGARWDLGEVKVAPRARMRHVETARRAISTCRGFGCGFEISSEDYASDEVLPPNQIGSIR